MGARSSLALSLALVLASTPTRAAAPAPAGAEATAPGPAGGRPSRSAAVIRTALRVGTTDYGGSRISASLVARVEAQGLQALRAAGFITAVNGEYLVDVVLAPQGDESYVTTIAVYRGDEELDGSRRRSKCELCLEDEVLVQIQGLVRDAAERIDQHVNPPALLVEAPAVEEPASPPTMSGEAAPPPPEIEEAPPRRGLGPAGRAGVGTLAAGGVALGAGVGLFVSGERRGADTQIPSFVLMGVGSLALVTGIGLLVVDREGRRSQVAPAVSPQGAGLVWIGRF